MKNLLKKVVELDIAYLDTFSNRMDRSWGYLLFNEDQPSYYAANHALLHEAPDDPKAVIDEVIQFFSEKRLIPRFFFYDLENQAEFLDELYSHNFKYEELVSPIQLWNGKVLEHHKDDRITIERVTEDNFNDALEIECSIKELGGREVREKAFPAEFKHPAFSHYLLRFEGVPCSTACIFERDHQARMESVATLAEFRGKGLIGELIYFLQAEVANRGCENFWVFPINERVEKVYARYGFETAGKIKTGHAFLSGKSILEIQEG